VKRPLAPEIESYVDAVVATIPPLTDQQRMHVSSLLWPVEHRDVRDMRVAP